MTLDDFPRVNEAALASIETLLSNWLPNGIREGNEFCVGSRDGEAGRSMKVRLTGDKAGIWSDFSDDAVGNDMISLYAYIFRVSAGKACAQLAEQLGIELTPNPEWEKNKGRAADRPRPAPAAKPAPVKAAAPAKPRTVWEPILPVPADAGPYPKAHVVRGRPDSFWEYRNEAGQLLGVVNRFTTSDGGKEVLPCIYAKNPETGHAEWRWRAFPEPRPLYLKGPVRDGVARLIVEGEKCADTGHAVLGEDFDLVSWPGGCKAVSKADWTLIHDCDAILWADADSQRYKDGHEKAGQLKPEAEQPGMKAMLEVAEILQAQNCNVYFVDIPAPGEKPDGWDIHDLVAGGATYDDVLAWATKLRAPSISSPAEAVHGVEAPAAAKAPGASTPSAASARGVDPALLRSMLIPTANGGVKGCRENVFTVMENDARLIGLVGLDLFSGLQVKRRAPPWPSEPGEWTENDDFRLGMYMAQNHGLLLAAIGDIEKGVAQAAREHSFNPVTDYLDQCVASWDGHARVATAFSTYWGAKDCEYLRLVATMFMVGIVVRAYRPGVKNDYAPVFEGSQGEGKSTALKVLGGDWFADTPFRMGEKDGYLSIQGVLLYEVAELEQFNRSEVTAIKAFMSSTVDRFREPYGRRMKNVPRRCAFAATTNEDEYFKDTTGNRRFWPVDTGRLDLAGLARDRDQLFGEAVHMLRQGVKWWPTRDQQRTLIDEYQESREIPDIWHGRVYEYVQGIDADGKPTLAGPRQRVTAREILTKGLHVELSKLGPSKNESMRISAIMRKLGWTKDRETSGARERYYQRPAAEPAQGDVQP
jgi:putative DNA primase/helicase